MAAHCRIEKRGLMGKEEIFALSKFAKILPG
jgi:hypothetical protein